MKFENLEEDFVKLGSNLGNLKKENKEYQEEIEILKNQLFLEKSKNETGNEKIKNISADLENLEAEFEELDDFLKNYGN